MIARMKRSIFLLLCLCCAAFAVPMPARAARADSSEAYAVAPTEDVWFYAGENEERRLFLLPCTYYVRVLSRGDEYTAVEYLMDDAPYRKILGYCKTESLLFVDFVPARPFLRKQITVSYSIPDAGGFGSDDLLRVDRTFVYYGNRYENGALYLYVLSGDTFGYLPAAEPPVYERNDDYLSQVSGEEAVPAPESASPGPVQIVVICLVCAAGVAVAALVLRGKRPRTPQEQSDF